MLAECVVSKLYIRRHPSIYADKLNFLTRGERVEIDASTLYASGAGTLATITKKPPAWTTEAWNMYRKHTGYIWCKLEGQTGYVATGTKNKRFPFMKFIYPREIEIKLRLSLPVTVEPYSDGPLMIYRQGGLWICSVDSDFVDVNIVEE